MIGAVLRAIFGGLSLTELIRYAVKFAILMFVWGLVGSFVDILMAKIPPLRLHGCAGYYASAWGFIDGFRLFVSIVLYGFLAKYAFAMIAKFFD